jgi:hypothetical protein
MKTPPIFLTGSPSPQVNDDLGKPIGDDLDAVFDAGLAEVDAVEPVGPVTEEHAGNPVFPEIHLWRRGGECPLPELGPFAPVRYHRHQLILLQGEVTFPIHAVLAHG